MSASVEKLDGSVKTPLSPLKPSLPTGMNSFTAAQRDTSQSTNSSTSTRQFTSKPTLLTSEIHYARPSWVKRNGEETNDDSVDASVNKSIHSIEINGKVQTKSVLNTSLASLASRKKHDSNNNNLSTPIRRSSQSDGATTTCTKDVESEELEQCELSTPKKLPSTLLTFWSNRSQQLNNSISSSAKSTSTITISAPPTPDGSIQASVASKHRDSKEPAASPAVNKSSQFKEGLSSPSKIVPGKVLSPFIKGGIDENLRVKPSPNRNLSYTSERSVSLSSHVSAKTAPVYSSKGKTNENINSIIIAKDSAVTNRSLITDINNERTVQSQSTPPPNKSNLSSTKRDNDLSFVSSKSLSKSTGSSRVTSYFNAKSTENSIVNNSSVSQSNDINLPKEITPTSWIVKKTLLLEQQRQQEISIPSPTSTALSSLVTPLSGSSQITPPKKKLDTETSGEKQEAGASTSEQSVIINGTIENIATKNDSAVSSDNNTSIATSEGDRYNTSQAKSILVFEGMTNNDSNTSQASYGYQDMGARRLFPDDINDSSTSQKRNKDFHLPPPPPPPRPSSHKITQNNSRDTTGLDGRYEISNTEVVQDTSYSVNDGYVIAQDKSDINNERSLNSTHDSASEVRASSSAKSRREKAKEKLQQLNAIHVSSGFGSANSSFNSIAISAPKSTLKHSPIANNSAPVNTSTSSASSPSPLTRRAIQKIVSAAEKKKTLLDDSFHFHSAKEDSPTNESRDFELSRPSGTETPKESQTDSNWIRGSGSNPHGSSHHNSPDPFEFEQFGHKNFFTPVQTVDAIRINNSNRQTDYEYFLPSRIGQNMFGGSRTDSPTIGNGNVPPSLDKLQTKDLSTNDCSNSVNRGEQNIRMPPQDSTSVNDFDKRNFHKQVLGPPDDFDPINVTAISSDELSYNHLLTVSQDVNGEADASFKLFTSNEDNVQAPLTANEINRQTFLNNGLQLDIIGLETGTALSPPRSNHSSDVCSGNLQLGELDEEEKLFLAELDEIDAVLGPDEGNDHIGRSNQSKHTAKQENSTKPTRDNDHQSSRSNEQSSSDSSRDVNKAVAKMMADAALMELQQASASNHSRTDVVYSKNSGTMQRHGDYNVDHNTSYGSYNPIVNTSIGDDSEKILVNVISAAAEAVQDEQREHFSSSKRNNLSNSQSTIDDFQLSSHSHRSRSGHDGHRTKTEKASPGRKDGSPRRRNKTRKQKNDISDRSNDVDEISDDEYSDEYVHSPRSKKESKLDRSHSKSRRHSKRRSRTERKMSQSSSISYEDSYEYSDGDEKDEAEDFRNVLLGAFFDLVVPVDDGSIGSGDSDSTASDGRDRRARKGSTKKQNQDRSRGRERDQRDEDEEDQPMSSLAMLKQWWKNEITSVVMKDLSIGRKPDELEEENKFQIPKIEEFLNQEIQKVFSGDGIGLWNGEVFSQNGNPDIASRDEDKKDDYLERGQDDHSDEITEKTSNDADTVPEYGFEDWLRSLRQALSDGEPCGQLANLDKNIPELDRNISKSFEIHSSVLAKEFEHLLPHLRKGVNDMGMIYYSKSGVSSKSSFSDSVSEEVDRSKEAKDSEVEMTLKDHNEEDSEEADGDSNSRLTTVLECANEDVASAANDGWPESLDAAWRDETAGQSQPRNEVVATQQDLIERTDSQEPNDSLDVFLAGEDGLDVSNYENPFPLVASSNTTVDDEQSNSILSRESHPPKSKKLRGRTIIHVETTQVLSESSVILNDFHDCNPAGVDRNMQDDIPEITRSDSGLGRSIVDSVRLANILFSDVKGSQSFQTGSSASLKSSTSGDMTKELRLASSESQATKYSPHLPDADELDADEIIDQTGADIQGKQGGGSFDSKQNDDRTSPLIVRQDSANTEVCLKKNSSPESIREQETQKLDHTVSLDTKHEEERRSDETVDEELKEGFGSDCNSDKDLQSASGAIAASQSEPKPDKDLQSASGTIAASQSEPKSDSSIEKALAHSGSERSSTSNLDRKSDNYPETQFSVSSEQPRTDNEVDSKFDTTTVHRAEIARQYEDDETETVYIKFEHENSAEDLVAPATTSGDKVLEKYKEQEKFYADRDKSQVVEDDEIKNLDYSKSTGEESALSTVTSDDLKLSTSESTNSWEELGPSVFNEWRRKRNSVNALKKLGKLRFMRKRFSTSLSSSSKDEVEDESKISIRNASEDASEDDHLRSYSPSFIPESRESGGESPNDGNRNNTDATMSIVNPEGFSQSKFTNNDSYTPSMSRDIRRDYVRQRRMARRGDLGGPTDSVFNNFENVESSKGLNSTNQKKMKESNRNKGKKKETLAKRRSSGTATFVAGFASDAFTSFFTTATGDDWEEFTSTIVFSNVVTPNSGRSTPPVPDVDKGDRTSDFDRFLTGTPTQTLFEI